MTIPTFVNGFPQDGSSLGASKVQIRNNIDGTFQAFSVDHVNQNSSGTFTPVGAHNVIHMTQQAQPAQMNGLGQLFTNAVANAYGTDEVLYYLSGANQLAQLTMNNIQPNPVTNGYTYLTGAIVLQWGTYNSTGSSGSVGFNLKYLTNPLNIQITPRTSGATTHAFTYAVTGIITPGGGFPNGGFTWIAANGPSSASTGFYWTAIGN